MKINRPKYDPFKTQSNLMQKSISFKSSDFFSDANLDDSITKNDMKHFFKQEIYNTKQHNVNSLTNLGESFVLKNDRLESPEPVRGKTKHEIEVEDF